MRRYRTLASRPTAWCRHVPVELPSELPGPGPDNTPCRPAPDTLLGPLSPDKAFATRSGPSTSSLPLPDLHLVLAGDGSDRRDSPLRPACGAPAIRFTGWRRPGVAPASELFGVPSRTAAGINAALERMSAGKPVVAAHKSAAPCGSGPRRPDRTAVHPSTSPLAPSRAFSSTIRILPPTWARPSLSAPPNIFVPAASLVQHAAARL